MSAPLIDLFRGVRPSATVLAEASAPDIDGDTTVLVSVRNLLHERDMVIRVSAFIGSYGESSRERRRLGDQSMTIIPFTVDFIPDRVWVTVDGVSTEFDPFSDPPSQTVLSRRRQR